MSDRESFLALLRAFAALNPAKQAWLLSCAETMARLQPRWLEVPPSRPQRRDLRPGDRVLVYPTLDGPPRRQLGTVIYIHPQRRYYAVALDRGCVQCFRWGEAE